MLRIASIFGLTALIGVSGCVTELEPGPVTLDPIALKGGCDPWECGTNSPQISAYGFHELSTAGYAEPESQFRLLGFKQQQQAGLINFTLHVVNGHLSGTNGQQTIQGQGLLGAYMVVGRVGSTENFAIQILQVSTAAYWANTGVQKYVESYLLKYGVADRNGVLVGGTPMTNLCSNPPARGGWETRGMNTAHTLLFEGDRIDGSARREYGVDNTWFNFGCAGHTLAKMYLSGHVQAAQVDGFVTSLPQRTTIIKMFSADYCGAGASYTVTGMPLDLHDNNNWLPYPAQQPISLEARWNEYGAICVRNLRGDVNPTPEFLAVFDPAQGKSLHQVMAADGCAPPPCADNDPNLLAGAHLVSANPAP